MTATAPHQAAFSLLRSSQLHDGVGSPSATAHVSALSKAILAIIAATGLLLGAAATNRGSSSLTRLADRVERSDVLPEKTRQELRRAIATLGTKAGGIDDRSADALARIERAMQSKPAERNR
jgi:hypothetical protein